MKLRRSQVKLVEVKLKQRCVKIEASLHPRVTTNRVADSSFRPGSRERARAFVSAMKLERSVVLLSKIDNRE